MPKFAKRFLIAVAALLVVLAVVLLCINLYLQSGGVQQRIHAAVLKNTGVNFTIGSMAYTPWGGLVLKNISAPDPQAKGQNFMEARALRIRFSLPALFEKKFIVTECILAEPILRARQLESGDWMIPLPAKEPPVADAERKPAPTEITPKAPTAVFRAHLEKFQIRSGTVLFVDRKGRIVLQLDKVNIAAQIAEDLTASGTFEVGRANVGNYVKPNDITGPFTWDGQTLELPEIKGFLASGKLTGNYRALVLGAKPSFALDARLEGVLIKKLFRDAGLDPGKTDGRLNGELQLAGDPRTSDDTEGRGHFELESAQLKPMDFLTKLGELFQIEELQLLKLNDARMDLTIKNERVTIDSLVMKSENLILRGKGPIRFSGKMDLDAELLVNSKLQQQLRGMLGKNFRESDEAGYRQLDFNITGRLESPKTDLLDKLIGINIGQDVGGMFKSLFRSAPAAKPATEKSGD